MTRRAPGGHEAAEGAPATAHRSLGSAMTALLAAAHAILFMCAFEPIGIWPLVLIAPLPLAWLAVHARSWRSAVLATFVAQFVAWMFMQQWLAHVTVIGYPLLAVYQGLFAAALVWVLRRAAYHRLVAQLPMTLRLPIIWVAVEFLRGDLAFNGYPWFLLGHPLIEWPVLAQSADIFGAYWASFMAAMPAGVLMDFAQWWRRRTSSENGSARNTVIPMPTYRMVIGCAVIVIAVHIANIGYGQWRIGQVDALVPGPTVIALQTNLPQSNKMAWPFDAQVRDVESFLQQTLEAWIAADDAGKDVALIVWPETMLPGYGLDAQAIEFVTQAEQAVSTFPQTIHALHGHIDVPLLIGSFAYENLDIGEQNGQRIWTWDALYNACYLIDGPPPHQRYEKVFLTPFGETMPYISNWPWLERQLLVLAAGGMRFGIEHGQYDQPLRLSWRDDDLALITPICFEVTVSRVCRALAYKDGHKRGDVLVNLSNDGWFAWFDGGRAQHLQIARWRCIELRMPMLRAVNTGLSASIDSRGIVRQVIGPGRYGTGRQPGTITDELPLDRRVTVYGRIGNLWPWSMLVLTIVLVAIPDRGD